MINKNIKKITIRKLFRYINYKKNSAINYFQRADIPFSEKFVRDITDVVNRSSTIIDEKILYRNPIIFPEIEELQLLWGIYKNITRMYRKSNFFDLYYNWNQLYEQIEQEDRVVIKDLFEMWYIQHFQPKKILEIGTRTGKSLISKMIFHYDIDNTLIFSIDPFVEQGSSRKLRKNLKRLGANPKGLAVFVGFSKMIIPEIRRVWPELYFDFILVDGSHVPEDAYNDLCMCSDLLRKGGMLCFDDLGPGKNELLPSWEKWKKEHGELFLTKEYYKPYGFGVAKKL